MTQENFRYLFDTLNKKFPEQGFQFDGKDTISCPICLFRCSGILINIIKCDDIEDGWTCCYELKNANGQIWDKNIGDIQSQCQEVIQEVEDILALLIKRRT